MRLAVFIIGSMALLSGCQQFAWKAGAGPAELSSDTASCRAQSTDEALVQDCLKQRGWLLKQPKTQQPETADDETATAGAPLATSATPGVAPAVSTAAPAATPNNSAAVSPPSGGPTSTTAVAPRHKVVPKPAPVDPLATQVIQAWWKAGAQGDSFAADQADCLDKLGPAYKPDLQNRLYSRGLIYCLKTHGWSGH